MILHCTFSFNTCLTQTAKNPVFNLPNITSIDRKLIVIAHSILFGIPNSKIIILRFFAFFYAYSTHAFASTPAHCIVHRIFELCTWTDKKLNIKELASVSAFQQYQQQKIIPWKLANKDFTLCLWFNFSFAKTKWKLEPFALGTIWTRDTLLNIFWIFEFI